MELSGVRENPPELCPICKAKKDRFEVFNVILKEHNFIFHRLLSSMQITIILGSKSDIEIAKKVEEVLKKFGIEYKIRIASAHRTPEFVKEIVEKSNSEIFIAIAGLSAALPGIVASQTIKPVIGVPVSGKLNIDAILSILQMPSGISVATVGLDNGTNAGLLAVQILALNDKNLQEKLVKYRKEMEEKVIKEDREVRKKSKAQYTMQ